MPRRKPAAKRQGRGTSDVGELHVVKGVETPPLPRLSGKVPLKYTREVWRSFWSSSLPQLLTAADHVALLRLFGMYDERERLDRQFRRSPFVTGSTGQTVAHPSAKLVASLDGRIVALEDRFGITPLARMKLGIAVGEAARSLEDLNSEFDEDLNGEEIDPRVGSIEVAEVETGG